jgi:hypothetical protein
MTAADSLLAADNISYGQVFTTKPENVVSKVKSRVADGLTVQ